MRRLFSMFLAILMTACIPIPTGWSSRPGVTIDPLTVGLAAVIVKQIRTGLTKVRNEIPSRRAHLHRVRCGSHECYESAEVSAAITRIRREVQAAFPPKDALASRISIDEEILETSALTGGETQPSIQLVRNAPNPPPSTIDGQSVETIFKRIGERIDRYLAHEVLNPTIQIRSIPDEATFEMQVGNNPGSKVQGITNNELPSVWRGHYLCHAHKPNYRDADDSIDLFNSPRTKVQCKLVSIRADAAEASHCWLED